MKESGTLGVLAYLMFATLVEVALFRTLAVGTLYYSLIGIIAVSEAVAVGAYFMRLKYEPLSVRAIALVGILFIAVLIISMVLNYVH